MHAEYQNKISQKKFSFDMNFPFLNNQQKNLDPPSYMAELFLLCFFFLFFFLSVFLSFWWEGEKGRAGCFEKFLWERHDFVDPYTVAISYLVSDSTIADEAQ